MTREMTIDEKNLLVLAKFKARQETTYAVQKGVIKKLPCRICGTVRSEAHHPDYSKPLEVVWLCKEHHMNLHHGYLDGWFERTDLNDLQAEILYYLEMDSDLISLPQLAKDCDAPSIEAAAFALSALVIKGYLKPVTRHEVDATDITEFFAMFKK